MKNCYLILTSKHHLKVSPSCLSATLWSISWSSIALCSPVVSRCLQLLESVPWALGLGHTDHMSLLMYVACILTRWCCHVEYILSWTLASLVLSTSPGWNSLGHQYPSSFLWSKWDPILPTFCYWFHKALRGNSCSLLQHWTYAGTQELKQAASNTGLWVSPLILSGPRLSGGSLK